MKLSSKMGSLTWNQQDPITQLRVILGALEGETLNVQAGCASSKAPGRMLDMLNDAKIIAEAIAKGADPHKWDT